MLISIVRELHPSFLSLPIRGDAFVSVMRATEPCDTFVKFTFTPQSTPINTTTVYRQHTGAQYTKALPFLFPLPPIFSHVHTDTVKQALACVNMLE